MATRFEVTHEAGQFLFVLRGADNSVLLRGLPGDSKIMVQNEILHLRRALGDPTRVVAHGDGSAHFGVIKDNDGSVLAKSPHLTTREALDELLATVRRVAVAAPTIDLAKRARAG